MGPYLRVAILCLIVGSIMAKSQCQVDTTYDYTPSVLSYSKPVNKRLLTPTVEILSINTIINRFDYWVLQAEWANVSWADWKENIKNGFGTDGDSFGTNFFAHPYHGSLYFNAARSTGRTFLGSIPYVALGSLTWEYLGENEYPSEIDIGTTLYGGIYLGEITHRLSSHLLTRIKNKKGNNFFSGLAATILNPTSRFNSLLYEDNADLSRADVAKETPVRSQFSIGANFPFGKTNDKSASTRMHINYSMLYGDLFNDEQAYKPFDFFIFRIWADVSVLDEEHPIFLNVLSHGPVWRTLLSDKSVFAISNHYDFLNNEAFKIGAMSMTADYALNSHINTMSILGSAKVGIILFGSSNSEVAQFVHNNNGGSNGSEDAFFRDYVYGRGLTFEVESLLTFKNNSKALISYNNWIIYTSSDAKGIENSSVFEINYFYPIYKNWSLGLQAFHYRRLAKYDELPQFANINEKYVELKIMSTLTF